MRALLFPLILAATPSLAQTPLNADEFDAATVGDTIEVAQFSSSKVVAVGYATVTAEDIAAS